MYKNNPLPLLTMIMPVISILLGWWTLSLLAKAMKLKKVSKWRLLLLTVVSLVSIDLIWMLSTVFIPLVVLGFVVQWAAIKLLLRLDSRKALGLMIVWDVVLVGFLAAIIALFLVCYGALGL